MSEINKTPKLLKRNKFRIYRRFIFWVLFVVAIIWGFFYWINNDSLKIKNVEIFGNKFVSTSEILNIFEDETSGKHFFLISRKNFLFIPRDKIENRIEKLFPVENVFIERNGISGMKIEVLEYEPVATYCKEEICYFVNKNGLLFIEVPDFYVDELILLEGEISSRQYTDQTVFQNLIKIAKLLLDEKIKIAKITTDDFETYALETVTGTNILVEKEDDPITTVENFRAALSQESIHEIQFNNIDYFDLRFEDKVFYKLK